jgi:hypothetical protein
MGRISGWWFLPTPLTNDGVRQLGLGFPTEWENTYNFLVSIDIMIQEFTSNISFHYKDLQGMILSSLFTSSAI